MTIWVDAQLSPALARWLTTTFAVALRDRPVIAVAGAAVKQAAFGAAFGAPLDARIGAAYKAVETLRLAEPRMAPWLAVAERLLRKWAPG